MTQMNSADMNTWKGEVTDIWGKWLPHLRDTTGDYETEGIMIYGSKVEVQKTTKGEIDHQDVLSKQTACNVHNGKDLTIEPNEAKSGMKSSFSKITAVNDLCMCIDRNCVDFL